MAKITFQTELPDSMLRQFLQYLRDFEQRAPDKIHMQQWCDAPDMKLDEIADALNVIPGFPLVKVSRLS